MGVAFLFCLIIYVILAALFVQYVWKHEKKRVCRWLAVAFVILLPSWDVVLGNIVYYTACSFVSKVAIYETAETDGIYYEGGPRSILLFSDVLYFGEVTKKKQIAFADNDLRRGYQYVESRAASMIEDGGKEKPISPTQIYRCIPLPQDPRNPKNIYEQCISVDDIRSIYMVKTRKLQLFDIEISSIEINNRATGQLMGEYREMRRSIAFPFFTWLGSGTETGRTVSCPERSRLYDFQFEILKLKK